MIYLVLFFGRCYVNKEAQRGLPDYGEAAAPGSPITAGRFLPLRPPVSAVRDVYNLWIASPGNKSTGNTRAAKHG
ncbi:hypothetical protein E2C01_005075 [Portunus trituberculatus]|uniref:Uncharacterized protein n=1 Tax=Portunus trituberculatus TaxID=210409 RepID=A0A5B7CT15_PORTR|nr:hypothetical protein [Portunus trituberculatus]